MHASVPSSVQSQWCNARNFGTFLSPLIQLPVIKFLNVGEDYFIVSQYHAICCSNIDISHITTKQFVVHRYTSIICIGNWPIVSVYSNLCIKHLAWHVSCKSLYFDFSAYCRFGLTLVSILICNLHRLMTQSIWRREVIRMLSNAL